MNIAVNVRTKICTNLREDNIRSERRWERCALEALLQADWVDSVYSLFSCWESHEDKPNNFIDGLPKELYKDTICIFSNFPRNLMDMKFKAVIINSIGEGETPFWEQKRKEVKDFYGHNFVYIMGYPWPHQVSELKRYLGDYFEFLPVPLVPEKTDFKSHFDKNMILWSRRGIGTFIHHQYEKSLADPFEWVAAKMDIDSNIEFHILSGDSTDEFVNYESLQKSPNTRVLTPYMNRIAIHNDVGWSFVQELYNKTKIVINPPGFCFENSEIESSSFGVPVVQTAPIEGYPWVLSAKWGTQEYYRCLDRLYTDACFYNEYGIKYKNYVDSNHTYKAFSDNLYNILKKKQLI